MLDLDETLIDRSAAFRAGVTDLFAARGLPPDDVDWVMEVDGGGYTPREDVAAALIRRYGLATPVSDVVRLLRRGAVEHVTLAAATRAALQDARRSGWAPVIVTNGNTEQQRAKIRAAGLDELVAGWVISEAVGVRKPEPGIFQAAADTIGESLDGGWMIGDNAAADIGGAVRMGLSSAWIRMGREWAEPTYEPTYIADTVDDAINHAVADTR